MGHGNMIRNNIENVDRSLGLGPHLVGKQIEINGHSLEICKQLGEGGFSFVYLVRNKISTGGDDEDLVNVTASSPSTCNFTEPLCLTTVAERHRQIPSPRSLSNGMVLKITSVHNTNQRHMAEKEAKLLQMLSHPSIVQIYDHGFRRSHVIDACTRNNDIDVMSSGNIGISSNDLESTTNTASGPPLSSKLAQHLILMEYCEGGTAFDAIKRMKSLALPTTFSQASNSNITHRFDLPSLVISFGQICNAVSYLHAQRPPIIHRDLKPVNFLIKNGAYKLCDFGSAVVGHTDLRTPESRRKTEEIVNKTTTQMFRAPEMVDLFMTKRLTQSTDVWALGCCLYSLAFLCDCFEEGSNLAILSRKFKIPNDNPYGVGLVELIDRMLAGDYKGRADMSEVIMCLSALYSNRPLPRRRTAEKVCTKGHSEQRMGAYRTDGQGIHSKPCVELKKKVAEAKKLDPNSAAAKRKKASEGHNQIKSSLSMDTSGSDERKSSASHQCLWGDTFLNFATFDQVFAGESDPCPSTKESSNNYLSCTFEEQCLISAGSSSHHTTAKSCADSAFGVTYQGHSTCVSSHQDSVSEKFGHMEGVNSSSTSGLLACGNAEMHNCKGNVMSGKKKRGLFGILSKSTNKF